MRRVLKYGFAVLAALNSQGLVFAETAQETSELEKLQARIRELEEELR